MRKRISRRKNAGLPNDDDLSDSMLKLELASDDENEISVPDISLVVALCEQRRPTREGALISLIRAFRQNVHYNFAKEHFGSLLYDFLNSLKHGDDKEVSLAADALALLALTIGYGDDASELLKDSFAPITRVLTTESEESKAKALQCLAIITFIGANDPEETERAMQMIRQFIDQNSGSDVATSPDLTVSAIHAWSFLLTTVTEWGLIDYESWHELAYHFSSLLEEEDQPEAVVMAAGHALAILFEIEDSKDFSGDETLKKKIINQVENLSIEEGSRGYFESVYEFIEKCCYPKSSNKYGQKLLTLSTLSEFVQLKFFRNYLGYGSLKHIEENKFFRDVFEMTPEMKKKENSDRKLTGTEKAKEISDGKLTNTEKRMYKSPNSYASKARSKGLRKQRSLFQRNMGNGHFHVMDSGDSDYCSEN